MISEDMAVFFDLGEWAVQVTRQRAGLPDVQFAAIVATADEQAFDGHATSGRTSVHYAAAAADVLQGDTLQSGAAQYVVLEVLRVNDGRECLAIVREVAA